MTTVHLDAPVLATRFRAVRDQSTRLCETLEVDDFTPQSMPDASPVKWHLAHTTWFFEQFVLAELDAPEPPFDPAFAYLFNSYYEGVGDRHARPRRGLLTRPTVGEVFAYRRHVDDRLQRVLDEGSLPDRLRAVVEIGLHHEQQHQELLLTDAKHLLAQNALEPAFRGGVVAPAVSFPDPLRWLDFEGGLREIGHAGDGFAFDNETPRHRVYLKPFQLADRLVTNAEYLEFVEADGYRRPEFWLSDGWGTVLAAGWTAPLYWRRDEDGAWSEYTLDGRRPLDPAGPVCHVSGFEADAFARFAGARLPTEAEWEVAVADRPVEGNLVESNAWHPRPAASDENGPRQAYGDVWEWTASPYVAYPGFRPLEGTLGEYNGKFMCNQLVLRGGSCSTSRSHVRPTYRNFFPPPARWQFSGIRLAR